MDLWKAIKGAFVKDAKKKREEFAHYYLGWEKAMEGGQRVPPVDLGGEARRLFYKGYDDAKKEIAEASEKLLAIKGAGS